MKVIVMSLKRLRMCIKKQQERKKGNGKDRLQILHLNLMAIGKRED